MTGGTVSGRSDGGARCDHDLEERLEWTGLGLDTRRHECLPTVSDHDHVSGLDVRRGVLEEADVVAGVIVQAIGWHGAYVTLERVEDPEYRRLGDTNERLIGFAVADDFDRFNTVWESPTVREQRMVAYSLTKMVAHLRAERGDAPGSVYGPP